MDEHFRRAGGFAFFLFPTAEGAEADAEELGEILLGEVEGVTDFGDLALRFPCLGRFAALGLRVHGDTGESSVGQLLDAEDAGRGAFTFDERVFPPFEVSGAGWSGDRFHGFLRLRSLSCAALRFSDSFLA